jgi:protein-tyrosine phosphatase
MFLFVLSPSLCYLSISLSSPVLRCMAGKFVAFAGPHAERQFSPGGYHTLRPEDYLSYFKKKNVTLVIRLNKSYYDAKKFMNHGIDHMDLYFLDGSNPPENILTKFIAKCEETPGAVAVHCKAGLGRTGKMTVSSTNVFQSHCFIFFSLSLSLPFFISLLFSF